MKSGEIKRIVLKIEIQNDDPNHEPFLGDLSINISENMKANKMNIISYFENMVQTIRDLLEREIE